jgi:hypothetical protein
MRSGKKIKLDQGGQHKIVRNENFEIDFRKSKESSVRMGIHRSSKESFIELTRNNSEGQFRTGAMRS